MRHFFTPKKKQVLYHFTTIEGAAAILKNRTLRLSEFSMMNDKSEYLYSKSKFLQTLQNPKVWVEEIPRWMVNIKLNAHESSTMMMIGCLTEDRDDVGLWDRYASSGRGCVLGFDANWLHKRAGVAIRKISYDENYLRSFANSGLAMLQSHFEENRGDIDGLANLATMFILDLYCFKDPRFRSEREVRISRLTSAKDSEKFGLVDSGGHRDDGEETPALPVLRRQGAYGPVRFIELPLWDKDEAPIIRSLGFGPNIDTNSEELLRESIKESPEIKLWKSDLPLR